MNRNVLSAIHSLGVQHFLRACFRRRLLVLAYHGFREEREEGYFLPFLGTYLTAAKFEEQLRYLKKYYMPVPLAAALESLGGGKPLADNAVVLTIDDGYRSVYKIAYPLLQRYGVPATVFLTTGFLDGEAPLWVDRLVYTLCGTRRNKLEFQIDGQALQYDLSSPYGRQACVWDLKDRLKAVPQDNRDEWVACLEATLNFKLNLNAAMPDTMAPLSWGQVREMQKSGLVSFGAHSRTHVILARSTAELCRREVRHSRERLEAELGAPCRWFAYPNGGTGDFDGTTRRVLSEEGYQCAFVSVTGLVSAGDDLMVLKRVPVLNWMDLKAFALQISLVIPWLRRVKDRLGKGGLWR